MQIEITQKNDGTYLADCTDLAGSVPIGKGKTANEALGHLFRKMSKEIIGNTGVTWLQKYFNIDIILREVKEGEKTPEQSSVEGWEIDL
jgi:hypothetical protein